MPIPFECTHKCSLNFAVNLAPPKRCRENIKKWGPLFPKKTNRFKPNDAVVFKEIHPQTPYPQNPLPRFEGGAHGGSNPAINRRNSDISGHIHSPFLQKTLAQIRGNIILLTSRTRRSGSAVSSDQLSQHVIATPPYIIIFSKYAHFFWAYDKAQLLKLNGIARVNSYS